MICPVCAEQGTKSTVRGGGTYTTAMWCAPWWDEEGVYHSHDYNTSETEMRCSLGHQWVRRTSPSCPAGDFPGSDAVVVLT